MFLDFWTKKPDFQSVVECARNIEVTGTPLWKFHLKLKNVSKALSDWSRNAVRNIFNTIKALKKEWQIWRLSQSLIILNLSEQFLIMLMQSLFFLTKKNNPSGDKNPA